MVKIAPSILAADPGKLAAEVRRVDKLVDLYHIDVMDGVFVPNITYGPDVVRAINKATKKRLEAHLMIIEPHKYIKQFAEAGADIITIHVEAKSPLKKTLRNIRKLGKKAGISINPKTPLSRLDGLWDEIDYLLIMSVQPGFGGQGFIESVLPKIRKARKHIDEKKLKIELSVDGGINDVTGKMAKDAGVDILVAGSYIYRAKNAATVVEHLR